jgi:hypothetical protein
VISLIYKWLLGPYVFVDITSRYSNTETMTVTTIDGTITTIHCQERRYLCRYNRQYVKDHVVCTYRVFATVHGPATYKHIQACRMRHSFPRLLHPWMSSIRQKEAVIEAYMDLLLNQLQSNNSDFINTMP